MEDKRIQAGEALNDDELEAVAGGVHDEDIFRAPVRVCCRSCGNTFTHLYSRGDTVIDTACPICGARVFVDFG